MSLNKLLISVLIFIISLPVFIWLESGFVVKSSFDLVKPIIFSIAFTISINNFYKRFLLITSVIFLIIMLIFYLFWKIDYSNWFGSVGFGMFTIYVLGYLPELLKKGSVDKI